MVVNGIATMACIQLTGEDGDSSRIVLTIYRTSLGLLLLSLEIARLRLA